MEHFARELLNRLEVNNRHARIHLWDRSRSVFYINNVCFRLEKIETNAKGYLIYREEKQPGFPVPNVVCILPQREYETACDRLDTLFEDRDFFYIRTSKARNRFHRCVVFNSGYKKYLYYFLDIVLLDGGYIVETFDTLNDLKYGYSKNIKLK